jgi:hypothetical protein
VKSVGLLLLTLLAVRATAATAYVSDELVLGLYAEQNGQGQRLATLHSGASVETLAVNGDFTEVRLNDGTVGWVKSAFLTTREPATVRVKKLEEELDQRRATTPALAEAAARSEVEQLKRELAARQADLDAALRQRSLRRYQGTRGLQLLRCWRRSPAVSGWGTPPWRVASNINSAVSRSIDLMRPQKSCSKSRTRHVAPMALRA